MTNNIINEIIAKSEYKNVEIIIEDGEPLFELYSLGMALGYTTEANGKVYPHKTRINKIRKNAEISGFVHKNKIYLPLNDVRKIISCSHSKNRVEFINWLKQTGFISHKEVFGTMRKEEIFEDALAQALLPFNLTLETQIVEGSYRFDMRIPELNLIIEYDEDAHSSYDKDNEEEREQYIRSHYTHLLRLTDYCTLYYNIGKVLKYIATMN